MCGIAGILKLNGATTPEDIAAVQRMMDAQVHRGPGGSGLFRDGRVVLGHRRLSILDLSEAGRQPMSNEDGTVWVTYNGEVYNFQELREVLIARRHRFRPKTDTEVLDYAAYHACIALLESRGLKPSNFTGKNGRPARRWEHGIIIAQGGANPVFQSVLTTKLGLQLSWLYTLRIRSDYKPGKPLSVKQAEEVYKAAEQIVQKVEVKLR